MWFRKLLLGVLTLGAALTGLVFGALFVLCLSLYVLWHGLSASVFVFGGLCAACTIVAHIGLRQVKARDESKVLPPEATRFMEEQRARLLFGSRSGTRDELKRRKMR